MFSQITPTQYLELLEKIDLGDHVYNGNTEQLVIWGDRGYDQEIRRKIDLISSHWEM